MSVGLLEGLKTGWGMMNQNLRQKENDRRYNERMERQKKLDGIAEEQRQFQNTATQTKLDQEAEIFGLEKDLLTKQKQTFDDKNDLELENARAEIARKKSLTESTNLATASRKEQEFYNKQLRKLNNAYKTNNLQSLAFDPDFQKTDLATIFTSQGRAHAHGLNQAIQAENLEVATYHFNHLYKQKLNKAVGQEGADGGKITDITATAFEQDKDGNIRIKVRVTTDKNQPYDSYISELRTGKGNDKVKLFSVDDLLGKASTLSGFARLMEGSGELDIARQNTANLLGATESQDNDPAKVRAVKARAKHMGISLRASWEIEMLPKINPQKLPLERTKYIERRIEESNDYDSLNKSEQKAFRDKHYSQFNEMMGISNSGSSSSSQDQDLQDAIQAINDGIDKDKVIEQAKKLGFTKEQIQQLMDVEV